MKVFLSGRVSGDILLVFNQHVCLSVCLNSNFTSHLFDSADGGHVVHLSAPLVVAVVLSPLGHVPQVLTAPEVVMLVTDPSLEKIEREKREKS